MRTDLNLNRVSAVVGTCLCLLLSPAALAQTGPLQLPVNNFQPAASTLNFYVTESGQTLAHLVPSASLYLSYAHRPLTLRINDRDEDRGDVVKYRANVDLLLAVGFWNRLELGLALPVTLSQDTDDEVVSAGAVGAAVGPGVGDLRIIAKVRLLTRGPLSLALSLPLSVPSGSRPDMLGDEGVTLTPRAVASVETRSGFAVGFNAGYRIRGDQSIDANAQDRVVIDDDIFLSLGVKLPILRDRVELVLDGFLSVAVDEQDAEEVPAELLAGLRFHFGRGISANVGAGPGLTRGIGTPTFRLFTGLGYHYTPPKPQPKPQPKPKDSDHDGLLDRDDKCPSAPEDKDGFEDEDGCPDEDNDGDGIVDEHDRCVNDPEDKDGFEDDDGCPDKDNDGDGVLDAKDKCPNEPETFNNFEDEDGCPDKGQGPVQIQRGKITVPPVFFASGKDKILTRSKATLALVAETLKKNAWVKKVRIEGHTDDRGDSEFNLALSDRRAASVKRFLIAEGVEQGRLDSRGFGEEKPVADNKTRKGRGDNRRVEFIIVDPPQQAK